MCAPQTSPLAAVAALAACPLPTEALAVPPAWPDTAAALVAGWYRRSGCHAPAPPGMRELVQTTGEGFGPHDHPTTTTCLVALDTLASTDAVDAGCGSGLLSQAWARLRGRAVLAVDLDPAAVAQTRASAVAAGVGDLLEARTGPVDALAADELAGRVVLANIPATAHTALLGRFAGPPYAAIVSGIRPWEAPAILEGYQRIGLRHVRAARHGRFDCHVLVRSR